MNAEQPNKVSGPSTVTARKVTDEEGIVRCKGAVIAVDTASKGNHDAFNPAELLMASLAGCMIKSLEKAATALTFAQEGMEIQLEAQRQDIPPAIDEIRYRIIVDSNESDHRLQQLHQQLFRHGTICNTLKKAISLDGHIVRRSHE